MTKPNDPAAFILDMLSQWDKSGEAKGEGMPGGLRVMMERAMSATNMPSKTELADIAARLGRVEAALFRIEGALADMKGTTSSENKSAD